MADLEPVRVVTFSWGFVYHVKDFFQVRMIPISIFYQYWVNQYFVIPILLQSVLWRMILWLNVGGNKCESLIGPRQPTRSAHENWVSKTSLREAAVSWRTKSGLRKKIAPFILTNPVQIVLTMSRFLWSCGLQLVVHKTRIDKVYTPDTFNLINLMIWNHNSIISLPFFVNYLNFWLQTIESIYD